MNNSDMTTLSNYALSKYKHLNAEAALLELVAWLTRNQPAIYVDIRLANLPNIYLLEQHIDSISPASESTKLCELHPHQYYDVYPSEYRDEGLFSSGNNVFRLGDIRTLEEYYIRIARYSFNRAEDGAYRLLFNVFGINAGDAVFYDTEDPGVKPHSAPLSICLLENLQPELSRKTEPKSPELRSNSIWDRRYKIVVGWLLAEAGRRTGEHYTPSDLQDAYEICCGERNLTKRMLWSLMQSHDIKLFFGSGHDFFKPRTSPPKIKFRTGRPVKRG